MRTIKRFWSWIKNEETEEAELRIDGDIGESFWGWLFDLDEASPKKIREELKQHGGKDLTVWINSNGGDVYAASQIFTSLKEYKGKVTVKIDGIAASAASVIAMAGDEIIMSPTSVMMIHNPWTGLSGEAKDFRHIADVLDEVKETIMSAYRMKTGLTDDEISDLMDDETWMGARKAIDKGFADSMLYEDSNSDESISGMVNGAKMVFNSIMKNKPDLTQLNKPKDPKSSDTDHEDFLNVYNENEIKIMEVS
ncbi:Clp protease ClpP [Radiobacillus kanasensis]|uniref:head maturation protease, ClpP-related n=1 Tax=Radiobacillus kanasensis TaxID=2844358 RepID=UPI001E5AD817|nr:head maturation protease, ClpP-related [Radiobacillus kanasensis]UFT98098.1 Clp protease ClpP [Radiobacillus kanasensis]